LLIAFTELGEAAIPELQLASYYRIEVVKKRDTHDMEVNVLFLYILSIFCLFVTYGELNSTQ